MTVFYDDGGAIGRRYRRQDEVGTPFWRHRGFRHPRRERPRDKGTVTMRHRDSMEQERVLDCGIEGLFGRGHRLESNAERISEMAELAPIQLVGQAFPEEFQKAKTL